MNLNYNPTVEQLIQLVGSVDELFDDLMYH
jgi:hypothetical protein